MTRRACIISGEGAKGSWQSAILCSEGKAYDLMIGVSSGALNAVGYSTLGQDLQSLWDEAKSLTSGFGYNWKFLWDSGAFTAVPLMKRLTNHMVGKQFKYTTLFPSIHCPTGTLTFVTYDVGTVCQNTDIPIIASAGAIAGVVTAINGCVDGGFRTLCPITMAIDDGCDEIDVVLGQDPFTPPSWPDPSKPKLFGPFYYGMSIVGTMLWQIMHNDIMYANECNNGRANIRLIYPSADLGSPLAFKNCTKISNLAVYPPTIKMLSDIPPAQPDLIRIARRWPNGRRV